MNKSNQGYKQENEKRIITVVGDKKKKKKKWFPKFSELNVLISVKV